jgi:hypothetical protein
MGDIKKVLTKVGKLPSFDYLEMLQRHWRRKRAVVRRKGKVIIVGGREMCQLVSLR